MLHSSQSFGQRFVDCLSAGVLLSGLKMEFSGSMCNYFLVEKLFCMEFCLGLGLGMQNLWNEVHAAGELYCGEDGRSTGDWFCSSSSLGCACGGAACRWKANTITHLVHCISSFRQSGMTFPCWILFKGHFLCIILDMVN